MDATRRLLLAAAGAASAGLAGAAPALAAAGPVRDAMGGIWSAEGLIPRAGGSLHYVELGQGEPLILLPKLGGWVADWRKVAPLLAANRRVIAIDPPGHGDSRMLGDPPYVQSVAESAAMIVAALDQLRIDRFNVVGNSLGGCISVELASFWPSAVRKLVLLSVSFAETYSWETIAKQDADQAKTDYDAAGYPLPRTAEQLSRFGSIDPAIIVENNLSRARAGRWLRPSERGVGRAGIANYLGRIQAPTLLMYGDQGYYRQYEPLGLKAIRQVSATTIKDSGSFTQQDQPQATAAAINAFLDQT